MAFVIVGCYETDLPASRLIALTMPSGDLREEFDIDSMDFLRLVTALGQRLDLPMPEADYPQMSSFDNLIHYLDDKTT